jgi:hypothetical protein
MSLDQSLRTQIEIYLSHLDGLIRRGRQIRDTLERDPSVESESMAARAWQEDCGIMINQLSGGSKSHWLARSFSQAFLIRSASGAAADGAAPAEIVQRLLDVLAQAVAALAAMDDNNSLGIPASSEPPPPRRFEFVHNSELRPVVERAYADSRRAFELQDFNTALLTSCGVLEAIVTDALEHKGLVALVASGAPAGMIAEWSFNTRLAVAEKAGLIRGGCARLPAAARAYRDATGAREESDAKMTVSERDARLAGQVLRVVMRDLDPGR